MQISERYRKALVIVKMGLRTEDDIKKNGLLRYTKNDKEILIQKVESLYEKSHNVLVLKN